MVCRKLFIAALSLCLLLAGAQAARAASLTPAQIDAVIGLMRAFGADEETIAEVAASLKSPLGIATPPAPLVAGAATCVTLEYNMGPGATDARTGGEVSELQRALVASGHMAAPAAYGFYGALTTAGVGAFQVAGGITPSGGAGYGYAGPKTRAALSCADAPPPPATAPASSASADVACHESNGMTICRHKDDTSVFYATPQDRVAYNVQVIHDGANRFHAVFHSEFKDQNPPSGGDSIRVGTTEGYTWAMPKDTRYAIWGTDTDKESLLSHVGNVGGGGNPMVAAGLPGDPYYYVFFLGVADDDRDRDVGERDWRHYLLEARTKDFVSFDLRTASGWVPFTGSERPAELVDATGAVIRSNAAKGTTDTQGLIGSIAYVNGVYHLFTVDYDAGGVGYHLYHRTTTNLDTGAWSAEENVLNVGVGMAFRIGKSPIADKWVVLQLCPPGGSDPVGSLCLQYTKNLTVVGEGGISELDVWGTGRLTNLHPSGPMQYDQPFWLTDKWGNPTTVPGASDRGGEIYWSDFHVPTNCSQENYPGCPVAGGDVWRAGWDVTYGSAITAPATPALPAPPQNFDAACVAPGTSALMRWDDVPGATSYQLWANVGTASCPTASGWKLHVDAFGNNFCYYDNYVGPHQSLSSSANAASFPTAPGNEYVVWMNAVNASGRSEPSENKTVRCASPVIAPPPPPPPPPPPISSHRPQGSLDGSSCLVTRGWAQDKDAPDAAIDVHIYIDKRPLPGDASGFAGSIKAGAYRADLCSAIGSCNHGFNFLIPAKYRDGRLHTAYAFGIDTDGIGEHSVPLPLAPGASATFACR